MLQSSSLRSKIARRIFALFVICGLLPFAGLALIAYHQTVEFFETKNQEQLRDLAKLFGLDIHEKLELLDASLKIIASTVSATGKLPEVTALERMAGGHKDRWIGLFLEPSDRMRRLSGVQQDIPDFTTAGRKQLTAGKAVISLIPVAQKLPARIFLSVIVDPSQSSSPILTGEVDTSYLWGFNSSRLLLSHIEPCVLDLQGAILMCSRQHLNSLPQDFKKQLAESTIGTFEWTEQGQHYLASYWTIPMKYEFQIPGWIILLKTSKEGAFASIKDLQKTFVLGIVVTVGLSILLAIFQIRKRLVPVEKLQEGTRRIAENDFGFKVKIQSNDEFDEIAASLNSMADRLGRQFSTITTTAEIDRAILSLLDTSKIVETILSRISAALHCDFGSLTLFNADSGPVRQWCLDRKFGFDRASGHQMPSNESQQSDSPSQDVNRYRLREEFWPAEATKDRSPLAYAVREAHGLITTSDPVLCCTADESTVPRKSFSACLGAPLMVQEDVLGVLSFYNWDKRTFTTEDTDFVKRLTNQAAVAIYNSQLYERTINHAAELLKANQAKDDFLSVMSHELRTPLNVIMGYVRILQDKILGNLTTDQTDVLRTVETQSTELLAMINSVMEATLIQTGDVMIDRQPIRAADIIDNLKSLTALPSEKSLEITWHCDANLPLLVSDRTKLEHILKITIDNAIKFTADGKILISANLAADQSSIVFKIADTGIGIPKIFHGQIFEIFRQVDNSRTREYGGLGLGLFIAKQLANLIGAEMHVESQVGQGSIFTIICSLSVDTDDTALGCATVPIAEVA
jgi:signal transduction histidine kinase/HAMP domain-containing protein